MPLANYDYLTLITSLEEGSSFTLAYPSQPICIWDFDLLKQAGKAAGFRYVVRNHYQGSAVSALQGNDRDATHREKSGGVDFYK